MLILSPNKYILKSQKYAYLVQTRNNQVKSESDWTRPYQAEEACTFKFAMPMQP